MAESSKGRFGWHELMTTDPAAAIDFYSKVVGWTTAPYEGTGQPYTMWMAGEAAIGGVMELPEQAREAGAPPHWMGYVTTPDAAATVSQATANGGKPVVPPFEVPTVGTIAVISDPQGAVISLLQPESEMPEVEPGPGHVSWCELMTSDPEDALSFYGDLFGWEKESEMDMGPAGKYYLLARGGKQFGGVYKPQDAQGPPAWLYYATVDSADEAAARVHDNGGKVLHGPLDVPGGGRVAICMDPQGAHFAVYSLGETE